MACGIGLAGTPRGNGSNSSDRWIVKPARWMAAAGSRPRWHPGTRRDHSGVRRSWQRARLPAAADVLKDDQPAARPQHSTRFRERPVRVADRAQHLGQHDGAEAGVGLVQRLGDVAGDLGRDGGAGQVGCYLPAHRGVRLGGHHAAGAVEVREVRPGPRAAVEHLASQVREQAGPPCTEHPCSRGPVIRS